jgi:histidyl-tRNA synthetase
MIKALQQAPGAVVPDIALVGADDDGRAVCEHLAYQLRTSGVRVLCDVRGRKVAAQMKAANRSGALLSATVGSSEIAARTVKVKTMAGGDVPEAEVALDAASLLALIRRP